MSDRIEELPESTCRQLLGSGRLGRVAVNGDPSPEVLPYGYVVHEDTVLFSASGDAIAAAAREGTPASFEVDGVSEEHRSGWSVLVRGELTMADRDDPAVAAALEDLASLPGVEPEDAVRLSIEEVTGRRIPADTSWTKAHRSHHAWTGRDATDLLG